MKGLLGVLGVLIGFPLICLGFLGTIQGCMLSHSEPEYSNAIAGYGMMALLFGSILCYAAWKYAKEESVCPNCRCWLADGVKTCRYCGADLK
jgi:hypothetical protein